MARRRCPERLLELFGAKTVVDLATIRTALGGVSGMTAFRRLKEVPYRRSYNYNGRFYALHEPDRYDRLGLWSCGDIHFSRDGNLTDTVRRMVQEAEAGATHRELRDWLRVRVHNTLLTLLRRDEIDRERMARVFVYLHSDDVIRNGQIGRRNELIASGQAVATDAGVEVSDYVVIQVLLTLVRHPSSQRADVLRRLHGHSPPITYEQVKAVFTRYDLGEKRGPWSR